MVYERSQEISARLSVGSLVILFLIMPLDSILENFVSQLESRKISLGSLAGRTYERIVFVGFGGSGLGARMVIGLKEILGVPRGIRLELSQNYFLPKDLSREEDLLIIISYSGNTLEAVACAKEAERRKIPFLIISSNGELKKLAKEWKVEFYPLGKVVSSRFSLSGQFYLLSSLLFKLGIIKRLPPNLTKISSASQVARAKAASRDFLPRVVLIYSSSENEFLAYDLKVRLNEDGKILAFSNVLPEAVHNEFLALEKNKEYAGAIFLKSNGEDELFLRHLDVISGMFRQRKINFKL